MGDENETPLIVCENCDEECEEFDNGLCEECFNDAEGEIDAWHGECDDRDEEWLIDGVGFADEGGGSALRAATRDNPRNLPCPTCGGANRLTPIDRARGYQCDSCADRAEGRGGYGDY
jgi:hypothetical protein